MAIAGKVAITLSTENGGAWSADVTYDRLVAVKHNNNLYISRKTVANVEPPNDEFWFLTLEGFGGDDVEALIDRMNELSDLIQAIIDGTTQVGNAKTLDGHEAENFFPKSGGTITGKTNFKSGYAVQLSVDRTGDSLTPWFAFYSNEILNGQIGVDFNGNLVFLSKSDNNAKTVFHTGNKPTGTYTGNGSATARQIAVGGIGKALVVAGYGNSFVVTANGAFGKDSNGNFKSFTKEQYSFTDGVLNIATADNSVNANTVGYAYYSI